MLKGLIQGINIEYEVPILKRAGHDDPEIVLAAMIEQRWHDVRRLGARDHLRSSVRVGARRA
jgi:hypothetical protein